MPIPEYRRLREQARQAGNEQSAVNLKETSTTLKGDRIAVPAGLAPQWTAPSTEQLFYKRLTDTEKLAAASACANLGACRRRYFASMRSATCRFIATALPGSFRGTAA